MKFCAWWMQLRVCKLRHQKYTIPCTTYFDLIKKYWKFAPVGYFKVGPYLQKSWICREKSMVMAHQRTWDFKSLSLEFIKQPIFCYNVFFSHFLSFVLEIRWPKTILRKQPCSISIMEHLLTALIRFKKKVLFWHYAKQAFRFLCVIFCTGNPAKMTKKTICTRYFSV